MMQPLVVVLATALCFGCAKADREWQPKITPQRDDDKVEVSHQAGTAVISVHSPSGISEVVIEATDGRLPEIVILHLHLTGLEKFAITNGQDTLHSEVSSHGPEHTIRRWLNGTENTPLTAVSPYWTDIRMVGNDGKPFSTIPLRDGYFEIPLPTAFFDRKAESITISWIDFYR